jgi:PAS domain S-box-containing protein
VRSLAQPDVMGCCQERAAVENNLTRVVDALPGLVWTALPDGHVDFLNQRWCEYTGLSADDAYGAGWQTAIHPEDLPALLERWRAILASSEPGEMEARLRRGDGEYRRFMFRTSPIPDSTGQVVQWCGMNTDVEDRKRAEEAGRVREDHYRLVADSIPALIAFMTPTGEVESVNRHVLDYFGATLEELKGWRAGDTVHPDDLPTVVAAWMRSVDTGEQYEIEHRIRRADGVYRWFHVRGLPLRDAQGSIARWYVLETDIDDRKTAEAMLRESESRLRTIIDAIPGLVWSTGPDGSVDFLNQPWCDYTGIKFEDASGAGWLASIHPDDADRSLKYWRAQLDSGQPGEIEARLRRFDGTFRWFLIRAVPLRDEAGRLVKWYGQNTDIDDRKQAESLLAGEKRLLEMMAGGHSLLGVLEALCQLVESTPGGCYCSVVLVDASGTRLERGVAPSLPSSFTNSILGRLVNIDSGPCATAAFLNEQVISADLRSETRWAAYEWCAMALAHGLQACWATPISTKAGKVLGAFAIYYSEPRTPTPRHQALIEQFTHFARIAVERAQSDAALKSGEARKAAILDSALDCVMTIDHEGCITEFNPAAERTFGYRRDEVIGKQMADVIIPPSLREQHRLGLARYVATGEERVLGRRLEITAVRADGSEFPVELAITRIPMEGPPSFTGYLRDITESKLAEEKLRESELNLRLMSETIPEMLWSATPEGKIDYCNARALAYSGLSHEEIMGNGWKKLLHPDDVDQAAQVWMSCVANGDPYRVEVRTLHAADHTYRWCITSALPLLDQRGRILKWFGTIVDMHDWKRAQEELRNTQADLAHVTRVMTMGQLTASIAHEVNQPLAGIVMNSSTCLRMLASDPPNVEGARETVRRTIRDGNRASEVIVRLRALFSKKNTTAEAMDLNEATREVVALSLSELQRNSVILKVELASDLPLLAGDRVQLQQVILNLLRNASDAMSTVADRPRQLLIRTDSDEGNHIRLTVQDAGTGFDAQIADRLFEPLYTSKKDGMGMGLSICRSIIESHHGRLWAALNDGPGATFSFSIPCTAEDVTGD